ncbi:AraC family transcriptional regulator [Rhodoferax mekongensis]|uniref:AraC family transcriptional regulator n=1 Tax=Rhodoferax mekongensis TaxID=3068341 RepID=A0ABZ0AYU4_9BURK|nr:AraC family transcriptional regulator [Rhodoferax sp. TBRC 17307]WNO04843.1 AraC family transcriptional regulator [Rhodoferax sp. TBRC 17307]
MPSQAPVAATPMAFARAMVEAYARYQKDPSRALEMAQITPGELQQSDARITAWQMERLSETAMRELDDEALGWFSRRLPWGSYGMLARASISAPTLYVALSRWCRHHGLIAPDITLTLSTAGDTASITLTEDGRYEDGVAEVFAQVKEEPATRAGDTEQKLRPPRLRLTNRLPEPFREFCMVSVLRNVLGVACWLIDSRITLLQADFPFEPPPHADAYAVLFPGPTRFQQARAAIVFDAEYLKLPLRRDEKSLQQMLQHALPLTVHQYRRDRLLVQQVRQLLSAQPQDTHSAEALAALLNVSPRTLHRQLREEGATLQALKDEVRHSKASELLLRSQRPIKQVAEAAGFQNEKSFIRAFKTWSGQTPAEFRRSATPGT